MPRATLPPRAFRFCALRACMNGEGLEMCQSSRFQPQFKIFLGTNHKPVIKDTDGAIWERIRLVPFVVQIPKEEREKGLDEQLQRELPGIFAWAVRGCLEWQRLGELQEPEAVVSATEG